jgi:PAS domain S-box-containing protein
MSTISSNRVVFGENDFLISKTDLKGKITYCNQIFMKAAGYKESELLGKPHNIIRHPDMPRIIYKLLWDRIQNNNEIFAYVKNKTKNGGFYWVFANITASVDNRGNIIGYYSVRRKVNESALETIENLYSKLLNAEKGGGMEASKRYLDNLLKEKGESYDEFIASLQG